MTERVADMLAGAVMGGVVGLGLGMAAALGLLLLYRVRDPKN